MIQVFIATCIVMLSTGWAIADSLRIASWNIANLAAAPGQDLRGYTRTEEDYKVLKRIILNLDSDIIALQEMGSLTGAQAVLGPDYEIAFEQRRLDNIKRCKSDVEDIYTAIACRKHLSDKISEFRLSQLTVEHPPECPDAKARRVRGGVGLKLKLNGQVFWIVSLHMKAVCKTGRGRRGETNDDCKTQEEQFKRLRTWISTLPNNDAVILAGDFNRRLLKTGSRANIRQKYFEAHPRIRQFLPGGNRFCWSRNDSGVDLRKDAYKLTALENNPEYDRHKLVPYLYDPWSNRDIDFFIIENASSSFKFKSHQIKMIGDYVFRSIGNDTLEHCDGSMKQTGKSRDPRDGQIKPSTLAFSKTLPSDHCPIVLDIN